MITLLITWQIISILYWLLIPEKNRFYVEMYIREKLINFSPFFVVDLLVSSFYGPLVVCLAICAFLLDMMINVYEYFKGD